MKHFLFAAAFACTAPLAAQADVVNYKLDASHSQVVFSYDHQGYSSTYGMFSGFEGDIAWDKDAPENSTVSVSMPLKSMNTGWEQRDGHIMSGDFFGASDEDMVSFTSTGIEVTGDDTALITGDLTIAGKTTSVVLDTKLNKEGENMRSGAAMAGFDATTTLLRSDFGVGKFAPHVSDEVSVMISIEVEATE